MASLKTLTAHSEDSQFVKNYTTAFLDLLISGKTGPGSKTNVLWEELTFHRRGVDRQTEALDLGSDGLLSPRVGAQQTPGSIQTSAEPHLTRSLTHN